MMKSNKIALLGGVFAVAVLIVIGAIIYSIVNDKRDKGNEMFAYTEQQTLGEKEANIHITVFSDFKCPACRTWDATVLPRLKEEYINKGTAQLHLINFPFIGEDSEYGAVVGEAIYKQDPEAFWTFFDELYQHQKGDKEEWITKELVTNIVTEKLPNINVEQLEKDANSKEIKDMVKEDHDRALKLKVQGAPSIYVNGNLVNPDYDSIKAAIEKLKK
ncbi:DsbA family protein [Bacillus manliponensis]|uniref:DsbA family protein n=1 Tax=Bacillus manliponensis TaxID=574376 RepID=UPI003516A5FB